jgi:hypothetical protein
LTDDLGRSGDSVDLPIDDLANASDVIAAFRDRRAEMGSPGQNDRILSWNWAYVIFTPATQLPRLLCTPPPGRGPFARRLGPA